MSLLDKIRKNSTIKHTNTLSTSKFFNKKDQVPTSVPIVNVALSGLLDGGVSSGITMWAGPSGYFKSCFSLLMAKSYMDKYPDSIMLFYDSEFGTPKTYFKSFGIDLERTVHSPLTNVEELKFDIMQQLDQLTDSDKIIILIDSIGNLASKKEVDDTMDGKSVSDMTRAKQFKSLFRMVTPHLMMKDIPLVVVNHTYMSIETYSKPIVSGGCVVENTKIKMSDGTLKNIQDIFVGDYVKTLMGNKEVSDVWNPETLEVGEPDCYEIEFEDGYRLICSDNHKFLVDGLWVSAKNLTIDMNLSTM